MAREAELCYSTLALVTDYDVWHSTEAEVSVDMIVRNLLENVAVSREVIAAVAAKAPEKRSCSCGGALKDAIITAPEMIDQESRSRLAAIIGKYIT